MSLLFISIMQYWIPIESLNGYVKYFTEPQTHLYCLTYNFEMHYMPKILVY